MSHKFFSGTFFSENDGSSKLNVSQRLLDFDEVATGAGLPWSRSFRLPAPPQLARQAVTEPEAPAQARSCRLPAPLQTTRWAVVNLERLGEPGSRLSAPQQYELPESMAAGQPASKRGLHSFFAE